MKKSKNDSAWEEIFAKYRILNTLEKSGRVSITSSQINKFREARLMTKFDHESQLPALFEQHKLSILPTSRGGYEIGRFETFCKFIDEKIDIVSIDFPTFLESINYKDITSEATAINCAFVSKILHNFVDEGELYPTVSGRMSSQSFNYNIKSDNGVSHIKVENAQIEIDGGYEGDNSLILIEAKNYISDDFLIRQLYYPFKLWSNKINKRVRPIFLTYSNGVFHLREYLFEDASLYNSIKLVRYKKYAIQEGVINTESIEKILNNVNAEKEPEETPFPQADSFERVINLCELLNQKGCIIKEEITQNYDFNARQSDYYSNAAKYLGLISYNSKDGCFLTTNGERIFNLSIIDRQLEFVKLILSHSAFSSTLKLYFKKGNVPSKEEVVKIMKDSKLRNIDSDKTYRRRASTIISWINWILGLLEA